MCIYIGVYYQSLCIYFKKTNKFGIYNLKSKKIGLKS